MYSVHLYREHTCICSTLTSVKSSPLIKEDFLNIVFSISCGVKLAKIRRFSRLLLLTGKEPALFCFLCMLLYLDDFLRALQYNMMIIIDLKPQVTIDNNKF